MSRPSAPARVDGGAGRHGGHAAGLMRRIWEQVSSPEVRPFVRLFFEVFAPWPTRWASRPTRSLCAWVSLFPVDS
jgi:hypothetical protein